MNKNHYKFVYSALIDSLNKASKYGKLDSTKITILNFLNDVFTDCDLNITQKNSKQLENLYYKLLRDLRQRCPNCYKNDIKVITKYTPDNKPPFIITAKKKWEDNNNSKDIRPEEIEVQVWAEDILYAGGMLNDGNNWEYTFEGLDQRNPDTNQLIDYYINELNIKGHYIFDVTKEVKAFSNDFVLTNTLTLEPSIYTIVATFDLRNQSILDKKIPFEGGNIVDSIYYGGLDINKEYTIVCKLINKDTSEDTTLEFTKNFTPSSHTGIEPVSFTLTEEIMNDLENGDYVIFTYIYLDEELIIEHVDIDDENETFSIKKINCNEVVANDDFVTTTIGESVTINVLSNDFLIDYDVELSIVESPLYGNCVINSDNTITYVNTEFQLEDSFVYQIEQGSCISSATVYITMGSSCGESLNLSARQGVFELLIDVGTDTGWFGLEYQARNFPDRFVISYNDNVVADSKYVGDALAILPPNPPSYPNLLGEKTNVPKYVYNGTEFVDTGETLNFTVTQEDISDYMVTPTSGSGTLMFYKDTAFPTTVKVTMYGPLSDTVWKIKSICTVPNNEMVPGVYKTVRFFLTEATKTMDSRTIGLWFDEPNNKFYINAFGEDRFYSTPAWDMWHGQFIGTSYPYINDGVTWWKIDPNGNILESGSI